jgi:hypothetical protein
MIKAMESMGVWMLGKLMPTVQASAGCPVEYYCKLCATCYLKRCHVTPKCGEACGSCNDGSCRSKAGAIVLC